MILVLFHSKFHISIEFQKKFLNEISTFLCFLMKLIKKILFNNIHKLIYLIKFQCYIFQFRSILNKLMKFKVK